MEWNKLEIKTTSQGAEIISAMLLDLGIGGVEIIDNAEIVELIEKGSKEWDYVDESLLHKEKEIASVIAYLGVDKESLAQYSRIASELEKLKSVDGFGQLSLSQTTVNDQTWLHEWKKHFHPFAIGRVLIVPEWDRNVDHKEDEIVFTIDPGSAFGTGQHATTKLCIEALQEYVTPGINVLDIGCGSGILSIISQLLGARSVTACDIDPAAVDITQKNAALNPVDLASLHVHVGDINTCPHLQNIITPHGYDIVIANIVADVIIQLAPQVKSFMKPDGIFIASGVITQRLEEVLAALQDSGLTLAGTKTQDGWCCIVGSL